MKSYVCKRCGKIFQFNRYSVLCPNCKVGNCVICGKEFNRVSNEISRECCSRECSVIWRKQTGDYLKVDEKRKKTCLEKYGFENPMENREVQEKRCKTNLEKYGVENPLQSKEIDEKRRNTNLKKYGVENPAQSLEIQEKMKKTNLERYGVEYASQNKEFQEKIRQTNLERYGVESFSKTEEFRYKVSQKLKSDEVKESIRQTNLERYGVENPFQNEDVKEKIRQTNLERYGVENPTQNEGIKEKIRQTNLERYGVESFSKTDEFKEKYRQTNLERYGVEYASKSKEFRDKVRQTNLKKYGVENPSKNPEVAKKISNSLYQHNIDLIKDPEQKENYRLFCEDPRAYLQKFEEEKPTYSELCDKTGLDHDTIYYHIVTSNLDCDEFVQKHHSSLETEVFDFLKSIDENIFIKRCDRQIIKPKEIDIYLPEFNLGIECNSTYVHNSSLPSFDDTKDPTPKDYHQKKSLACEEKGVFLFHLFGWEWSQKQEIMKSMLKNLLGKCDEKCYARKLKIVELTQQTCSEFLNENHRQGSVIAPVRLGLVTKDSDELLSVMTFGKMRAGVGKRKDDNDETWELSRFCSKLNTVVVGGASKLFKFFIDHFEPQKIVSFSDIAHTKGILYEKLGFHKVSITDPGYCYLHYYTDLMLSREQCQKQNLRKLFQDDTIDLENKTEPQIMLEHGFVQMYDSGSIRWEWTKEDKDA